jgi:hypothetical protein
MSNTEFIAVEGVIGSINTIVKGIEEVNTDTASEGEELPEVFRQALKTLPLLRDILETTKHKMEADNVSGVEKTVERVVNDFKYKWGRLMDLFDKVVHVEKAKRVHRYTVAARAFGKGGKVESLTKGILEDIQLLATIRTMTAMNEEKVIQRTTGQEEKVYEAIIDVMAWPASIPDDEFWHEDNVNNFGSGRQYTDGAFYMADGDVMAGNHYGMK